MLNQEIIDEVSTVALLDAETYFDEFQRALDPAETDWEVVAWSSFDLTEIEELGHDPEDYRAIYSEVVVEETERMFQEFLESFEIEAEGWTSEVVDWQEILLDESSRPLYPTIKICTEDLSEYDSEGHVIAEITGFPTEPEILAALPKLPTGLVYNFGDWTQAEDNSIVAFIEVEAKNVEN